VVERAPVSGSVESRSLESLAAARGITICFAELDGAEGLWLPEERTILLARGLSSRRAAEVLAHELEHVDIEDGHAALDAGVGHRHTGRLGTARWAVAATAGASLVLLFTVRAELSGAPQTARQPVGQSQPHRSPAPTSAPASPTGPATTSPAGRHGGSDLVQPRERVRTETVTVTVPPPSPAPARTTTPAAASHPTSAPPTSSPSSRGSSGLTGGSTGTNTPQVSSDPPATTTSPPVTTQGTAVATVGSAPAP
jgi:hypothetical protein